MKKFIAAFLTIIMVTSVFLSTTAMAADSLVSAEKPEKTTAVPESTFKFSAFDILSKDIVVDTEKRLIFGFDKNITEKGLEKYIQKGENFKEIEYPDHIGTGATVTLSNGTAESRETFTTVIMGDVNGDGTYDVLDALKMNIATTDKANEENKIVAGSPEAYAADLNLDGLVSDADYTVQVNGILAQDIDQNRDVTSKGTVDSEVITDKPYTGDKITADDEIKLTFNDGKLSAGKDFEVVGYKYNTEIGEAQVTVKGKGLYSGEKVLTFKIVDLLQDILAKASSLLTESKLSELVTVEDVKNNGVTDININVNATKFLNGNVEVNTAAFNNFLARLDVYKQEKLMDADIKVGNYQITTKGQLNNTALKNLIFDFVSGFFYIVANSKDNVIKQYTGNVVTGPKAESPFNVKFNITGNAEDITTLKNVSEKLARHFSFKVVNNNAVIDVKMPNAFTQKVVDLIGSGDVEQARAYFNSLTVYDAFFDYLAYVRPEHISQSSAADINKCLNAVIAFEGLANKVLNHVSSATIKNVDGKQIPFLKDASISIDKTSDNKFGAIVKAATQIMSKEVLLSNVSEYCKDGKYKGEFDISLNVAGIKETVILNLDLFGDIKTPDIIRDTADYLSSIVTELGINKAVGVTYDKTAQRVVGSVNATEILAGNFTMNDAALDGLLTNAKDFFNKKFANSDITIGSYNIVANGSVNKPELKKFIFEFANGFFFDVGNMKPDNVIRTFATVVKEANGKTHAFDLDFQLTGNKADTDRVAKLSSKIARYVSLDTSKGDATANVTLPASITNKIVSLLGSGNPVLARQTFDAETVYDVIMNQIAYIQPEHISQSSAEDVRAAINMICSMDGFVDKVLGKVAPTSKAYDAKGNPFTLLNGKSFVIDEASIGGIAKAIARVLNPELLLKPVSDYKKPDGTYSLKVDINLTVGGIKETLILNMDVFGKTDAPTEIDETVQYVDSIVTDLGIDNLVAVNYDAANTRACGSINATQLLNGTFAFNDAALDGLLTKTKDFFNQKFGDSNITIGGHKVVTKGTIDNTELKNFLFDFAHGFFYNVGNLGPDNIIKSFKTVVVNKKNETREFDLDFLLEGNQKDVERLTAVSGKVAKYVSLDTTTTDTKLKVVLPLGVENKIVEHIGTGDINKAITEFDNTTVYDLIMNFVAPIQPGHISETYAADIQVAVNMIQKLDGFVNKVLGKVTPDSKAYDTKGNEYSLLNGNAFVIDENSIGGISKAIARVLNSELILKPLSDYKNPDGTYSLTVDVGLTTGGIRETIVLNLDVFGLKTNTNKTVTSTSDGPAVKTATLKTYSAPATAEVQAAVQNGEMSVEIEADSRIKAKVNAQGGVPSVKGNLIVGVPYTALAEDKLFSVDDADSTIIYKNSDNVEFTKGSISTGTKVIVKNNKTEATFEFSIVSYGDANGDANLDVLDMHIASLYSLGKDVPYGSEASKEASKITENETLDAHNYGEIVNSVIRGEQTDKGIKKLISLCETEAVVPPTYTGTELTPNVSVLDNGVKVDSKNYKVTYENNINAGELTATAIIEGINGYTGIKRVPFTINKATIDDSILFDSYICPSNNIVGAKFTASDLFKKYVTVKYNGSTTLPTNPGVYKVTADIKEDSNYTFLGGQRDLGFMLVSPKSSTGYKIITDSANKNIYVDVTNALQDFTAFNNVIGTWFNTNYNLTVDGKNTAEAASVAKSLKQLPTMKRYYNGTNVDSKSAKLIEDRANVLGYYLPDIYTLWNNQNAESSTAVSISDGKGSDLSFNVVFRQDAVTIGLKKGADFVSVCGSGRGGRTVDPLTYEGIPDGIGLFYTRKVFVFSRLQNNVETKASEKTITVNFGNGNRYPGITAAFQGTGLKTAVLGPNNAVCFVSATTKKELDNIQVDINSVKLYDESANNRRFVDYGGSEIISNSTKFMKLVSKVLGGMNINVSLTTPTKNLVGKTGWCKYACQDGSTGLCYTLDYFLTFSNVNEADRHYNVKVNEVAGVKITTYPTQVPDSKTGWIASTAVSKGEGFTVSLDSASIKNGYKIKVTNATTGEEILRNNDYNCYIMPNSNVNVTAVK